MSFSIPVPAEVITTLPEIFPNDNPKLSDGKVKIVLDKELTAMQFMQLAHLAVATNCAPSVVRSGAGVSVIFS